MLKSIIEFLKARRIETGVTRGSPDQSTLFYASKRGRRAYGSSEAEAIYKLKAMLRG